MIFFLISSTCNWPWKDTLGSRVSLLCHLQFRGNELVLHFCKMRNGQITIYRKIFWTIFFHHIIGHDKLHFCAKRKVHDPYTLGAMSPKPLFFYQNHIANSEMKNYFFLFLAHVIDLEKTHLAAEFHHSGTFSLGAMSPFRILKICFVSFHFVLFRKIQ